MLMEPFLLLTHINILYDKYELTYVQRNHEVVLKLNVVLVMWLRVKHCYSTNLTNRV